MSSKLSDRIFNDIQVDIINGAYEINSRLPTERELSERYSASRFAIREAIAMLTRLGFVETHPQSGTYIRDFENEASLDMLIRIIRIRKSIDRRSLESLLAYRRTTETNAAGEAAGHITGKDIEYLRANLKRKSLNLTDIDILTECDYDFHHTVIRISRNMINELILRSFRPIYAFFTDYFYSLDGAPERSLELNTELVTRLKKKDRKASEKAMAAILDYAEKRIFMELDKRSTDIIEIRRP